MSQVMFSNAREAHGNARMWRRLADEFVEVSGYDKWRADRLRDYRKAKERYRWIVEHIRRERMRGVRYE